MIGGAFVRLSAILAGFLAITYTLCVLFDLAVPASYRMYPAWGALFPGFEWGDWRGFLIGFGEALVYGIYAAALYQGLRFTFFRRQLAG